MAREPVHPGEFLRDELSELGMRAAELVRVIHVPPNRISQILAGKRNISADTALRLVGSAQARGSGAIFSRAYELDLARQRPGDRIDAIEPRSAA